MHNRDIGLFAWGALRGYPTRTLLMLIAMAIGVAAVVMLTALGEGARAYVANQFSSLGTNLIIVIPGRAETGGVSPSTMMGETPRDLTLDDATALTRSYKVRRIAANRHGRSREVTVFGTTSELLDLRHWELAKGRFLPDTDIDLASPVCVIGMKVRDELFGAQPALGQWIRLGDRRFRVIGILKSEGRSIGVDVQDMVMIPVASAQQLFNTPSLFRILVEARTREAIEPVKQFIIDTLKDRHQGEEDVTVITQDAVLATFDRIFTALTYAVGGIAAISLMVAGILIMNVMLVAVSQRTAEIGLLKAEAFLLSVLGASLGLLLGASGSAGPH